MHLGPLRCSSVAYHGAYAEKAAASVTGADFVSFVRLLGGHPCDGPGTRSSHCFTDSIGQRQVRFHSIASCDEDHDSQRQHRDILLVFQVLVSRHEDIEVAAGTLQQLPVPHRPPPMLRHGHDIESLKQPFQAARKRLI